MYNRGQKGKCTDMPFWRRVLEAWGDFFLGSPRRTLILFGIGFGLYLLNNPAMLASGAGYLMQNVVAPLFQLVLVLAIMWWALRWMWRGIFPAKKRGGK